MLLLEKKLQCPSVSDMLERPRMYRLIEEGFKKQPILLVYGAGGIGKTVVVSQFLRSYVRRNYGYYCLDERDSKEEQMRDYLAAMFKNAGVRADLDSKTNVFDIVQTAFGEMEKSSKQYYLAFDQADRLEGEKIWAIVQFLLAYVPSNCRIFLICGSRIPQEFMQLILKKKISILSVNELAFNEKEIRQYFGKQDIVVNFEQITEIRKRTGGWSGAMHAVVLYLHMHKVQGEAIQIWENPLLDYYIQKNFWDICTDLEKEIMIKGNQFSYLTPEFIRQVLEIEVTPEQFLHLENIGFLHYDMYEQRYFIEEMIALFVQRNVETAYDDREILKRACGWYHVHGDIQETIECILRLGSTEALEKYLTEHIQSIVHVLSEKEIRRCLSKINPNSDNPVLIYVRGLIALWGNEKDKTKQAWHELERQYETNKQSRHEIGELMLNFLYENPEISIEQWLDIAEGYLPETGPISIFSFTADIPNVRTGVKDLSTLFMAGSKMGRQYRSRFKKICSFPVERILDLAEIDYMIETDREEQAVKLLQDKMLVVDEDMYYAELLGLVGILCKFQRRNVEFENDKDMPHRIAGILRNGYYRIAVRNVHACRIYSYSVNHSKDKLAQWMQYEAAKGYERITRENAYVQMIKAKAYLLLQQYDKARILFQRVAVYYESRSIVQFQAECLFGEAVALYSMGEKAGALKTATQAITLGTKYRYVGIYCVYGKVGVELIEQYQEMVCGGEAHQGRTKKKYYYGNALKASWEGYQSILLRCAKKKMRQTSAEFDMKKETLTLTELTILQHISNGCTNQEISELMNIKLTTVKTHIYSIYRKMDVNGRVQAINKGKEMGLL